MADKDGDETIHLKVKNQNNDEVFFKIKRTTQLIKLMTKYCERQNIQSHGTIRFLYDGQQITDKQTPNDLGMQNGDEIDVMTEQQGGSIFAFKANLWV